MAIKTKEQLKALLETGDILSQATFEDLIDSLPSIQDNNEDLYKVKTLTSNTPNGNDIGEEGILGQSPDGNIWFKKSGIDNTGWEKIFISTNEDFEANIGLSDVSDIVPDLNVLGLKGNNLVLGDGVTVGGNRTINSSELDPFTYFVASDGSIDMKNIIGELASGDVPAGSELVQIGNSVTSIGSSAFHYWGPNNQPLVIPDSVETIGSSAFYGWSANNQPLVIGDSVETIGYNAFSAWLVNNQPLVIPDSVKSIGGYAFSFWNANNQPLVIGDSVETIGDNAFRYWPSNNQPLVIGDSVTSIGDSAFRDWTSMTEPIYCGFNFSAFIYSDAFTGNGVTQIYVKPGATGWTIGGPPQTIQGASGVTVSNWDNYPNPIPN